MDWLRIKLELHSFETEGASNDSNEFSTYALKVLYDS
jgi:hypothetical protein